MARELTRSSQINKLLGIIDQYQRQEVDDEVVVAAFQEASIYVDSMQAAVRQLLVVATPDSAMKRMAPVLGERFDAMRSALEAVHAALAAPGTTDLEADIMALSQATELLADQIAQLQQAEAKEENLSPAPYLNDLMKVGNAVVSGKMDPGRLRELLTAVIEHHHRSVAFIKAPAGATEPQKTELQQACRQHLEGFREAELCFQDGDATHIRRGLDMSNEAVKRLYALQETFVALEEAARVRKCVRCGAENDAQARNCAKCQTMLPPVLDVQAPTIDLHVGEQIREAGHAMTETTRPLVDLVRAVQGGQKPATELLDLLKTLEERMEALSAQLQQVDPDTQAANDEDRENMRWANDMMGSGLQEMKEGVNGMRRSIGANSPGSLDTGMEAFLSGADKVHEVFQAAVRLASQMQGAAPGEGEPSRMEQATETRQLATNARQHELRGELTEAAELWRQLLKATPDDYQAHLGYGRVLTLSGSHGAAAEALRAALQRNPDGAEALFFLSRASCELGLMEAARDLFVRAAALDPLFDHPGYRERLFGVPGPARATEPPAPVRPPALHTPPLHSGLRSFHGAPALKRALREQVLSPAEASGLTSFLLYGPQDCGKRFLCRCLAGELGAATLELEGENMHVPTTEQLEQFIESHADPLWITVLRTERVVVPSPAPRPHGLPVALAACAARLRKRRVVVCFHSDVPWLLPRTLRSSRWMRTAVFVPPPDTEARTRLLNQALEGALPAKLRSYLLDHTEGFTTADLSALMLLLERHAASAGPERHISRYLEEDRTAIGPIDWQAAASEVLRVPPTAREWLEEARKVQFQRGRLELDALRMRLKNAQASDQDLPRER